MTVLTGVNSTPLCNVYGCLPFLQHTNKEMTTDSHINRDIVGYQNELQTTELYIWGATMLLPTCSLQ